MELIKKNIHMNRQKCRGELQVTLDNDINVPDIKPDIKNVITWQGDIKVQEMKAVNGKVLLKGLLIYHMLYTGDDAENSLQHMDGQIEFDEMINMNGVCGEDSVQVKCELEDLTTDVINSRKISVKSILNIITSVEEIADEQVVVDVDNDGHVQMLNSSCMITELLLSKKDTYRVKDEIMLPPGRDLVAEIIYSDIVLEGTQTRLLLNQLSIRGELKVYFMYIGSGEDRINAYETSVPFQGTIDCNGCDENMISHTGVYIQDKDIQIKPDEDGEDRVIDIEVVLGLDMKVYSEQEINMLTDIYSTKVNINPVFKDSYIDNLIIKNNCKVRVADRISLDDGEPPVMQISNAVGNVRIDDKRIVPGGIEVEGIIEVCIMYYPVSDNNLVGSHKGVIPFSQVIEAKGIHEGCTYELQAVTDMINVMVIDEAVIEVKAVIGLDAIVFERKELSVITDWQITDKDMNIIKDMPGVIGYVVNNDDTMWSIAKEFGVTIDELKRMNKLENDAVMKGQKLIIVKEI